MATNQENQQGTNQVLAEGKPNGTARFTMNAGNLKKTLGALLQRCDYLLDTVEINIDEDKLHIDVMDTSHVAMISANFRPSTLHLEGDAFSITIKPGVLIKFIRAFKAANEVSITITPSTFSINGVTITAEPSGPVLQGNEKEIVASFEAALKDKFTVEVDVPRGALQEANKFAALVDNIMYLETRNGELVISARDAKLAFSSAIRDAEFSFSRSRDGVKCVFSTYFMAMLAGIMPLQGSGKAVDGEIMTLFFADNMPLMVKTTSDTITYTALQAPRVEEDEDDEFGDDFDVPDPLDDDDDDQEDQEDQEPSTPAPEATPAPPAEPAEPAPSDGEEKRYQSDLGAFMTRYNAATGSYVIQGILYQENRIFIHEGFSGDKVQATLREYNAAPCDAWKPYT